MPSIGIADKQTLDLVKAKTDLIGVSSPSNGDLTTLFNGLKLLKDTIDIAIPKIIIPSGNIKTTLPNISVPQSITGIVYHWIAPYSGILNFECKVQGITNNTCKIAWNINGTATTGLPYIFNGDLTTSLITLTHNNLKVKQNDHIAIEMQINPGINFSDAWLKYDTVALPESGYVIYSYA